MKTYPLDLTKLIHRLEQEDLIKGTPDNQHPVLDQALERIGNDKALLYLFNRAKDHRINSLTTIEHINGAPRKKTKAVLRDSMVMHEEAINSIYRITMYETPQYWENAVDEEIGETFFQNVRARKT